MCFGSSVVERSGISQPGLSGPLSGLLERFRRTGGVPAAVGGDLASELAPVFAALDEIESEAAAVRRDAGAQRADREARLEREIGKILADALTEAERTRDEAFDAAHRAAEAEAAAIIAEGDREAAAIREDGAARLPSLVDEVVARVAGSRR